MIQGKCGYDPGRLWTPIPAEVMIIGFVVAIAFLPLILRWVKRLRVHEKIQGRIFLDIIKAYSCARPTKGHLPR